jgi:translocation and assembly module TamB
MRWLAGSARFLYRLVAWIGVVLIFVAILFTQTAWGREKVLREVLSRVEGGTRGDVTVEGISSSGLLRGFTFSGVEIRGENGRPFLRADSIRAALSASAVLRGDIVLTGVNLWRPRVTIERLPGEDEWNVVSIFVGGPDADSAGVSSSSSEEVRPSPEGEVGDTAAASGEESSEHEGRIIALRGVQLLEGSLDILLPISDADRESGRAWVEPGPDGRPSLRRYSFREIDLRLGRVTISAPEQSGERFELQHLSFQGLVWREPFRVVSAWGDLRREDSEFLAELETIDLPGSQASGTIRVDWGDPGGTVADVEGEAQRLALEDIWAVDHRLPEGIARGPFGLRLAPGGTLLEFRGTELSSSFGNLIARGGLRLGPTLGFRELELELEGVDLAITDPWVQEPLPLRGWLDGRLAFGGDLEALDLDGSVTLTDPDSVGSTQAQVSGLIHLENGLAATDFRLNLAPLEWGTLASVYPAMTLRGPGSLDFTASGALETGMRIEAEASHQPRGRDPTRVEEGALISGEMTPTLVRLEGRVQRDSVETRLNLSGELVPLSLTTLRRSFPDLPLTGEYQGTVRLNGPLSDLEVTTDLGTSAGPVSLAARFDARRPADHYTVEASAEEFLLSALVPELPEPTRLSGRASATGKGFAGDSIQGNAEVFLNRGDIGLLRVDTAALVARVQAGSLHLDALVAETELGRVEGGGSFGIASDAPPGELTLQFESESLEPLRPYLMEVPPILGDTLNEEEKRFLEIEGVDLSALPTSAEVALDGRLQGRAMFRGGLSEFAGEGSVDFQELRFKSDFVEAGSTTFSVHDLPGDGSRLQALVRTDSVQVRGLGFREGTAEVELGWSEGRLRVTAQRSGTENYRVRGTFALDSLGGGVVNLDQFDLQFDSVRWNLGGPASFAWGPEGYRVRDFQLIRPGPDNMRLRANGFLPREGDGDLEVEARGLNLARVARAIQMETPLEGMLDLEVHIAGSPSQPRMAGSVRGQNLRYADFSLSGLESEAEYGNRRLDLDLSATNEDRQVISAQGFFPLDLRLVSEAADSLPTEETATLDAPVDLAVALDSFPAGIALAFLDALDDVGGTLSGDLHFGGTSQTLAPSGQVSLAEGSAVLPGLGVRHDQVEASFVLAPDRTVQVEGSLRSGGRAGVTGTVTLDTLSNPYLDLEVSAEDFLAVSRRDFQGRVSDAVRIEGRYRRPRVEGKLTVEEGVMIVEEVARTAEVVDLTDPSFFLAVDTSQVTLRPVIRAAQNPFLQNLRLDVELVMVRDAWLRGRDLNAEMAGDLQVTWDRSQRNLTLLGDLQAIRGTYWVLGRQFQVREGLVRFQGVPGINPDLDIEALNRLRTFDNQRLDIIATVEGTLLDPRVSLSSDTPFTIAESDLVSYLIFGRPSYALASAQSSYARGAAGAFLGMAREAGTQFIMGTVSAQLGSVFARETGLDYLAITQGVGEPGFETSPLRGTVATTQVEVGQYLSEDVFASLLFRPLTGLGGSAQDQFAGLRVEWRLEDQYTLEGFWEDQYSRASLFRPVELGLSLPRILGLSFFKDWGY